MNINKTVFYLKPRETFFKTSIKKDCHVTWLKMSKSELSAYTCGRPAAAAAASTGVSLVSSWGFSAVQVT